MPLRIIHHGQSILTYALMDNGATACGISLKLAEKLQLPIHRESRGLSSWGYHGVAMREMTSFMVESLDGNTKLQVDEALVGEILTTEHEMPPTIEDIAAHPYMEGIVSFEELEDTHIGVLLSARFAYTWELGERVSNGPDKPIAVRTDFGWALVGAGNLGVNAIAMNCCATLKDASIEEGLERILRYDFLSRTGEGASPEQEHPSRDDRHAIDQFEATITFDEALGHYRCGVPWREDRTAAAQIVNTMDTASNAKNRLRKAAARMHREPERKEGVWKQIQEYIDEGHARRVEMTGPVDGVPSFYLPIHVVTRPDKPGKWRVCHDAAAKVPWMDRWGRTHQVCLNDLLLAGPDLVSRLVGVLLRFRWNPVVLSADIQAFFHQIFVDQRDVPSFRFFWYKDKSLREMVAYEMLVHIFGAKSSPAVATWVLRHHAKRIAAEVSPEVVQAILWFFYVDDLLASYRDTETARRVRIELTAALKKGGFNLLKWKSTHKGVLAEADEVCAESTLEKLIEDPSAEYPLEKVLGVTYSFQTDNFSVRIGKRASEMVSNWRQMLSLIASVFDPIGLVAPAVLRGKILFQQATSLGLDWDEKLPKDLDAAFNEWRLKLPELETLKAGRWVNSEETMGGRAELHLFGDASLEGYGAVAYLRAVSPGGQVKVSMVCAKAQVVPIETIRRVLKEQEAHKDSIPRLELTAARLAAILKDMIVREMKPVAEISRCVLWTDSETVMKWILDRKTRYKTFIHNRKATINELTDVADWRTVPSEENPADDCSRGLEPGDPNWVRFLGGPAFLYKSEENWPVQKHARSAKVSVIGALTTLPDCRKQNFGWALRVADRIESWPAKVRRIALLINFIGQWRLSRRRAFSVTRLFPTMHTVHKAQNVLIAGIQQNAFPREYEVLNKQSPDGSSQELPQTSPILHLSPFIDASCLLRAGGRMSNSTNLSYDLKYPKILPKDSHHVESLVREEHQIQGHAGTNHVYSALSQKYWVIHGREMVKRIIKQCVVCQRNFKTPGTQKMADLPAERVDPCSPFEVAGTDVFGPFLVRNGGRSKQKRWILLFTCFTTRAVHFELLRDLSSSTFINALVRFHARRPGLRVLWSDQGTNFRGADRELRNAVSEWSQGTAGELLIRGIEWRYSPPHAAHCGGVWERLIKDAKRHLSTLVTINNLDIDVLATVLTEVERIMNSRPLTYASSDIADISVLTPNDFLYPGVLSQTSVHILPPIPPGGGSIRYQWQKSRKLVDEFWSRWQKEYLHTLHSRAKWQKTKPDLYVGQIVILVEDNIPRDQWRIGRIESVGDAGGSKGGTVRKAMVRTTNGRLLERHVTKLVTLELD